VESIKRCRKALGMSLTDVAVRASLHDEAVARIEHPNVDPRASSIVRVARAMGVPVCALFDEPGHTHGHRKPNQSPPRRSRQAR
jgi:transcriptional regulator with XRE-family HTH domain